MATHISLTHSLTHSLLYGSNSLSHSLSHSLCVYNVCACMYNVCVHVSIMCVRVSVTCVCLWCRLSPVAALSKVCAIADAVNESKRQWEGVTTMINVQNRISGQYDLLAPHRHLVCTSCHNVLFPSSSFFLFSSSSLPPLSSSSLSLPLLFSSFFLFSFSSLLLLLPFLSFFLSFSLHFLRLSFD